MSLQPTPDSEMFDPHSRDAMFARILVELEQIKAQLRDFKGEHETTREKLASFEQDRWYQRGVVATISAVVGVGVSLALHWLKKD